MRGRSRHVNTNGKTNLQKKNVSYRSHTQHTRRHGCRTPHTVAHITRATRHERAIACSRSAENTPVPPQQRNTTQAVRTDVISDSTTRGFGKHRSDQTRGIALKKSTAVTCDQPRCEGALFACCTVTPLRVQRQSATRIALGVCRILRPLWRSSCS